LAENEPRRLDDYYAALAQLDPESTERAITRLATRPPARVAEFIERFKGERFLYDYLDDEKLLMRLNHVMRRVGLPWLPPSLADLFPDLRRRTRDEIAQLLPDVKNTCDLPVVPIE
jgi:hypothetical protein